MVPLRPLLFSIGVCLAIAGDACCQDASFRIIRPTPHTVVQRRGYVPHRSGAHEPGGPALGFADIPVECQWTGAPNDLTLEYRSAPFEEDGAGGSAWSPLAASVDGDRLRGQARVAAGPWKRLELRLVREGEVVAQQSVAPVGVGEVFVIAGQSYASNANDERLKVHGEGQPVAAFDAATGLWRVADDPQPTPDGSDGGSIWPAFGDLLAPHLGTPVGLANVAYGGTSSSQWAPGGGLHRRLVETGKALGRFRAVLWQQGESDVIAGLSTDDYVKNVAAIRDAAVEGWGFSPSWLLAKSTLHPTVYNDPAGEDRIRRGIDRLSRLPGFLPGPDTDVLSGENRGGTGSRRHFSPIGQQRAAQLWFVSVMQLLQQPRPDHQAVLAMLPSLHLLEPAWLSATVHRESSVLLQEDGDSPAVARLAFPAESIVAAASADGAVVFDAAADLELSPDGRTVTFRNLRSVPAIRKEQLFPPAGSANAYAHRLGHPEQHLLYAPGTWFHQRNVEISYRRRQPPDRPPPSGDLPGTRARLASGKPLAIAISGDSISTGLDASALGHSAPWQPGYPALACAQLEETYGCEVRLENRAVAGWSISHGLDDLDRLLETRPNLVIVAYGMNDVGRRDPAWFTEQARTFVERVRTFDPQIEVILVAPMLGNAEWVHTPREMFQPYRDGLASLTGPGVALADLTTVWKLMLETKHDLDLTGNGLNHPNDFGHRLYAQELLRLLTP